MARSRARPSGTRMGGFATKSLQTGTFITQQSLKPVSDTKYKSITTCSRSLVSLLFHLVLVLQQNACRNEEPLGSLAHCWGPNVKVFLSFENVQFLYVSICFYQSMFDKLLEFLELLLRSFARIEGFLSSRLPLSKPLCNTGRCISSFWIEGGTPVEELTMQLDCVVLVLRFP